MQKTKRNTNKVSSYSTANHIHCYVIFFYAFSQESKHFLDGRKPIGHLLLCLDFPIKQTEVQRHEMTCSKSLVQLGAGEPDQWFKETIQVWELLTPKHLLPSAFHSVSCPYSLFMLVLVSLSAGKKVIKLQLFPKQKKSR